MAPKGQAVTLGVRAGWRLTKITGGGGAAAPLLSVEEKSTSKDVLEALAAARKIGKPYSLTFISVIEGVDAGVGGRGAESDGGAANAAIGGSTEARAVDIPATVDHGTSSNTNESTRKSEEDSRGDIVGAPTMIGEHMGESETRPAKEIGPAAAKAGGMEGGDAEQGLRCGDGEVTLMYEMYDEKFPIKVKFEKGTSLRSNACWHAYLTPDESRGVAFLGKVDDQR